MVQLIFDFKNFTPVLIWKDDLFFIRSLVFWRAIIYYLFIILENDQFRKFFLHKRAKVSVNSRYSVIDHSFYIRFSLFVTSLEIFLIESDDCQRIIPSFSILRFLIFNQFFTFFPKKIGLSFCMTTERTNHHYWMLLSFDKPSPVINVRDSCSRASFRPRKPNDQPSLSSFFTRHDMKYTRKSNKPLINHQYLKYDLFNYDSFKNIVNFCYVKCEYLFDSLENSSLK